MAEKQRFLVEPIYSKINNFLDTNNLLSRKDKIIVALSGGADSVFLLKYLIDQRSRFDIQISAVHVNHNLRGEEATADEKFCINLCNEWKIELKVFSINVKEHALINKLSIEEAARELRYSCLEQYCDEVGFNKIATAHNLDDNTETVIQRLIEGTSIRGLCGIPIKRNDRFIRPILNISKNEIVSFLTASNIKYCIDTSNFDIDFKRNFIRNKILPLFSELNPSFKESIFRTTQINKGFYEFIVEKIGYLIDNYVKFKNQKLYISNVLFENTDSIVGEVLKLSLEKHFQYNFDYKDFINFKAAFQLQVGKYIGLKNNLVLLKEREVLIISENTKQISDVYRLKVSESIDYFGKKILLEQISLLDMDLKNKPENVEYLDYDCCESEEFEIRKWQHGDRFKPLGMNNFKKVSDFLTENKIDNLQKKEQFVLTNRNNIVYIIGLRIDNRYKITNNTQKVLKIWIN